MAEGIARHFVQENNLPLEVRSFGVHTYGGTVSRHGVNLLRGEGIDISSHRSTDMADVNFCNESTAKIVVMAQWHKEEVIEYLNREKIPFDHSKIVMLRESGVPDPVCGPMSEYKEVHTILKKYCVAHVKDICGIEYKPIEENEISNDIQNFIYPSSEEEEEEELWTQDENEWDNDGSVSENIVYIS